MKTVISRYETFGVFAAIISIQSFAGAIPMLVDSSASSAWISALIAALFSVLLFIFTLKFLKVMGGKSILKLSDELLQKKASFIFKIGVMICLLFQFAFKLNVCARLLKHYTYRYTDTIVIVGIIMISAFVIATFNFLGYARMVAIIFCIIAIAVIIILLFSYRMYEPAFVFPILGHGVKTTVFSSYQMLSGFVSIFPLFIFMDEFNKNTSYRRFAVAGYSVGAACVVLVTLATNLAFQHETTGFSYSALYALAKGIYLGKIFQRFEPVFMLVFCFGYICEVAIGVLAFKKTFADTFKLAENNQNRILFPISIIGICLCFSDIKHYYVFNILSWLFSNFYFVAVLLLFLVLIVAAMIKKKIVFKGKGIKTGTQKAISAVMVAVILSFIFVPLAGCRDYREIDNIIYPVEMGIDKGINNKYMITFNVLTSDTSKKSMGQDPEGSSGDENSQQRDNIFTVEGDNSWEFISYLNTVIRKDVMFTHMKLIIVSEELAKLGAISEINNTLLRNEIFKTTAVYIVCKGSAKEFISLEHSDILGRPEVNADIVQSKRDNHNDYPITDIAEFSNYLFGDYGDNTIMYAAKKEKTKENKEASSNSSEENKGYIAGTVPVESAEKREYAGAAIFLNEFMKGTLDLQETKLFLMMNDQFKDGTFSLISKNENEDSTMFTLYNNGKRKVKCEIGSDGSATIDVTFFLKAVLISIKENKEDTYNYSIKEFKDELHDQLLSDMNKVKNKLQNEYQADSLKLGRCIAKKFLTLNEFHAYDWHEKYKTAKINLHIDLQV